MSKGIYTLLISLDKPRTIIIGKRGEIFFPAGYYAYVGSALNGLEARIARHLKKEKLHHWHIDYFLQKARVEEIIYSPTRKNKECSLAFQLAQKLTPIPRFGCSDCRCASHLYFCKDKYSLSKTIKDSFKKGGLIPYVCKGDISRKSLQHLTNLDKPYKRKVRQVLGSLRLLLHYYTIA